MRCSNDERRKLSFDIRLGTDAVGYEAEMTGWAQPTGGGKDVGGDRRGLEQRDPVRVMFVGQGWGG